MMASSNGNILRVTGPLCGEPIILSNGPLETTFSEIEYNAKFFIKNEMSAKWRPFCLGVDRGINSIRTCRQNLNVSRLVLQLVYPIHSRQVLSREWRCGWSAADSRCFNYIWVINNFIAYEGATYIRALTVHIHSVIYNRSYNYFITRITIYLRVIIYVTHCYSLTL